jgi:hypothetical protein
MMMKVFVLQLLIFLLTLTCVPQNSLFGVRDGVTLEKNGIVRVMQGA